MALAVVAIALAATGTVPPGGVASGLAVGGAALLLTVVGFIDDMRGLAVLPRLAAQVIAVGLVVLLLPDDIRLTPPAIPLVLERAAVIAAGLWWVNLVNFMDGIDWISVTETAAITLGVTLMAALGVVPPACGIVAIALLGATAGFAPWNAPPARPFLGDAGSLPVGLLLGVLLLQVAASGALAPALILPLYYLADATITLIRRAARGQPVWQAHREHFYQQAIANGFSVRAVVARIAVLDVVLIALAVVSVSFGKWGAALAVMVAVIAIALTVRTLARGRR